MESMARIAETLKRVDSTVLVAWDGDMVLRQPRNPCFHMSNLGRHKAWFREAFGALSKEEQTIALCLLTTHAMELVDPLVLHLLADLRSRAVPHIALTACITGPLGDQPSLDELRLRHLRELRISFWGGPSETMIFEELSDFRGLPAIYKQGVLFSNGGKGKALVSLLRRWEERPTRIVFIDDRRHHLEDVEEELQANYPEIAYTGIHYTGAKDVDSPSVGADEFQEVWRSVIANAQALWRGNGGL